MNLYLISQDHNDDYDTYDSAVVAAENEDAARETHPNPMATHIKDGQWMGTHTLNGIYRPGSPKITGPMGTYDLRSNEYVLRHDDWVAYKDIDKIKVQYIGNTHKKAGVILAYRRLVPSRHTNI